jgi:hypothetical protein
MTSGVVKTAVPVLGGRSAIVVLDVMISVVGVRTVVPVLGGRSAIVVLDVTISEVAIGVARMIGLVGRSVTVRAAGRSGLIVARGRVSSVVGEVIRVVRVARTRIAARAPMARAVTGMSVAGRARRRSGTSCLGTLGLSCRMTSSSLSWTPRFAGS